MAVSVLIAPILMAMRVSVMGLQKSKAFPSTDGSNVDIKLNLHSFDTAIAVFSRSNVLWTRPQSTAFV